MAKKTSKEQGQGDLPGSAKAETALQPGGDSPPAQLAGTDLLGALSFSAEEEAELNRLDGLDEIDSSDLRLGNWIFNVSKKLKMADGEEVDVQVDTFFNTISDRVTKNLVLILLRFHKRNKWSFYDPQAERTIPICVSDDRKHGTMTRSWKTKDGEMAAGLVRSCINCPQSVRRVEMDAKTQQEVSVLDCAEEWNFLAIEPESGDPCVIRFKRTSLPETRLMVNKFFLKKRVTPLGRTNYPLFCMEVAITLKAADNGKYAVPQFSRGRVLSKSEILQMMSQADALRQYIERAMETADGGEDHADASRNPDSGPQPSGATPPASPEPDFDPSKLDGPADGAPDADRDF